MRRLRDAELRLPTELGSFDGLAYSLWLPDGAPHGGVVILHGAGSCKESHYDFARAVVARGHSAIAFDQRGHGESPGQMGAGVLADTAAIGELLRRRLGDPAAPLALRGSSMGGYLAILTAASLSAAAVVAICPASAGGLRRGLRAGALPFAADADALDAFLESHELGPAVSALEVPMLLLHAEGDEQVPVEHSRELASLVRHPVSRLITVSGGHHRSIQHDGELQAVSLDFITRALGGGSGPGRDGSSG